MVAAFKVDLSLRAGDNLGAATAILNDEFLVGAPGDSLHANATNAGAVYWMRHYDQRETPFAEIIEVITTPDPLWSREGARFGTSVAMADGLIAVGATKTQLDPLLPGDGRGAAYVFQTSLVFNHSAPSSAFYRRFQSDTPQTNAHFGSAVAFYAGLFFVGESGLATENYPAGSPEPRHNGNVYVFNLTSGALVAKVAPVDPVTGAGAIACFGFGTTLSITDGLLAVGAPRAKSPCGHATKWGAAFVFDTRIWNQTAKLTPARHEAIGRAEFGLALAWQDPHDNGGKPLLLVGAPGLSTSFGGPALGAVYSIGPFDRFDQTQHATVSSSPWPPRAIGNVIPGFGNANGRFGRSISVDSASGWAFISSSARFTNRGATSGGAMLTEYFNSNASSQSELFAPNEVWGEDSEDGDAFGVSVSLSSSGVAVIGASRHNQNSTVDSGAAYLFFPPFAPPSEPPSFPPSFPPPSIPPSPSPPPTRRDSQQLLILFFVVGSLGLVMTIAFGFWFGFFKSKWLPSPRIGIWSRPGTPAAEGGRPWSRSGRPWSRGGRTMSRDRPGSRGSRPGSRGRLAWGTSGGPEPGAVDPYEALDKSAGCGGMLMASLRQSGGARTVACKTPQRSWGNLAADRIATLNARASSRPNTGARVAPRTPAGGPASKEPSPPPSLQLSWMEPVTQVLEISDADPYHQSMSPPKTPNSPRAKTPKAADAPQSKEELVRELVMVQLELQELTRCKPWPSGRALRGCPQNEPLATWLGLPEGELAAEFAKAEQSYHRLQDKKQRKPGGRLGGVPRF